MFYMFWSSFPYTTIPLHTLWEQIVCMSTYKTLFQSATNSKTSLLPSACLSKMFHYFRAIVSSTKLSLGCCIIKRNFCGIKIN